MKTKIISILALLLTVTQGAWAQHKPSGNFEYAEGHEGSISVAGWAWDEDNEPNTPISVHVYVFKDKNGDLTPSPSNSNVLTSQSILANNYRSDIISITSDNGNHGFAKTFEVATPGTYYVCAWGIDGTDGNIVLGSGKDITILAPFTVSYNANGGSGAPSAQDKRYDITLTLSSTVPTRTGYTFTGWNTAADGTGTAYAAGATYSANADVTLYAQWTHHTTSGIDWNPSTNSGTFLMPAYNVEVSTELWYKVDEEKTLDENIAAYGTKSDFFLNRTLTADQWNTFASPFAIAAADMTKYFGAGAKVRQLSTTSVAENVLTLNFTDATEIVAGQPYLVKPAANVDFSADGKEFAGVDLNDATATPTATTYVNFIPTLGKTEVTGDVKDILILNASGTLVHPSATGDMKGFRGYFLMHEAAASLARAFVINFGDGETTGIQPIRMENGTTPAEGTYDLSGRRIQGQPTQKGVYIQNGKKVIIK